MAVKIFMFIFVSFTRSLITTGQNSSLTVPFGTPTAFPENTDIGVCTCDLALKSCDVNCCCDQDCTADDRQAFSVCKDAVNRADYLMCTRSDVVVTNNVPSTVDVSTPGIFCILTDNFPQRNYYTVPDVLSTDSEYLYNAYVAYTRDYSYQPTQTQTNIGTSTEYKSGDPIFTLSDSDVLGYLGVPRGTVSNICSDGNPAAYLYDEEFECTRAITALNVDCAQNAALDVHSYYEGFKIITNPALFTMSRTDVVFTLDTSGNLQSDQTVPDNRVKRVVPSITPSCYDSKGLVLSCTYTDTTIPSPSYDIGKQECSNVVTELQYVIHHQGIGGIFRIDLNYVLRVVKETDFPLSQKHSIRFYRYDHVEARDLTESHIFKRSGNPGYVVGLPVMAGSIQTDPLDSSIASIKLSTDSDQWFNLYKSSASGDCLSDVNLGTNREPIQFGVNMRSGCHIRFSLQNMTNACDYAQQVILTTLEGQTFPQYVAAFGNSAVENTGDWVQILADNTPTGAVSSSDGTCTGIVLGMHIEIIYANIGSLANPQPKIIGVRKIFEDPQTIRFQCTSSYCQPRAESLSQPFEVVSSVSFIDVSQPAVMVLAETPSVQAKLPYDFFWPFYYDSAACRTSCSSSVLYFVTFFLLIRLQI